MPRVRTSLTNIRELLRLRLAWKLPQRKVALASGCSLGTMNKVWPGKRRLTCRSRWPTDYPGKRCSGNLTCGKGRGSGPARTSASILGERTGSRMDYRSGLASLTLFPTLEAVSPRISPVRREADLMAT